MGVFEDLSHFLEARLDEFLQANPHLELMALEEQLRGQEADAINLLGDLKRRQKQVEDQILSTAQSVQRWYGRVEKARTANRLDLVQAAQERQATLLRQGNTLWGQMQGIKAQIEQTRELQQKIHRKRQELKTNIAHEQQVRRTQTANPESSWDTTGWYQPPVNSFGQPADPLEEKFMRWETEAELEDLKRQMKR
jgi:uncharacterized protein (TIGR04376 family)